MPANPPPFVVHEPTTPLLPIVVSIPHAGSAFPQELQDAFVPAHLQHPDDTDWFVEQLYAFAPAMGITVIHSTYCRYVVDLNRDPESKPLYDDGRTITGMVPSHTFLEEPLYQGDLPDAAEIERRRDAYYWPYHRELARLLAARKAQFAQVLLWEAHSIRRKVPTIRPAPFPDMILGDADGAAASDVLRHRALEELRATGDLEVRHNDPFKGGYITRAFGKPATQVHALQLEMAKDLYMDDAELAYHPERAARMQKRLKGTFAALAGVLSAGVAP